MDNKETTLPFESGEDGQETQAMKKVYAEKVRLEIIVNNEVARDVLSALSKVNVEATFYDAKGLGKEKQTVKGGRGTMESQTAYSTRRTIVTIVDSNQLDSIVRSIKDSVEGRGGVLSVSPIQDFIHL